MRNVIILPVRRLQCRERTVFGQSGKMVRLSAIKFESGLGDRIPWPCTIAVYPVLQNSRPPPCRWEVIPPKSQNALIPLAIESEIINNLNKNYSHLIVGYQLLLTAR